MAQATANPTQLLSNATAAGAGSSNQLAALGGTYSLVPGAVVMSVIVSGWAASYDSSKVAAYPYANVGLEVSADGSHWTRVANCAVNGNGTFNTPVIKYPVAYARANVDALDSRISAVTLNAYVSASA